MDVISDDDRLVVDVKGDDGDLIVDAIKSPSDSDDDNFADIDDSLHINSYNSFKSQRPIQPFIEISIINYSCLSLKYIWISHLPKFLEEEPTNDENDSSLTNNVIKDNTIDTKEQVLVPFNDNPGNVY